MTASMRASGQPSASAVSIFTSIARSIFTTPSMILRKNTVSEGWNLMPFDFATEPMGLEFGQGVGDAGARYVHLVEGCTAARRAAERSDGFAMIKAPDLAFDAQDRRSRLDRSTTLVQFGNARPGPGLRVILDCQDAVGERNTPRDREIHERTCAFTRHDVVCPVSPRMTQPSATTASYGLPALRPRSARWRWSMEFRARR